MSGLLQDVTGIRINIKIIVFNMAGYDIISTRKTLPRKKIKLWVSVSGPVGSLRNIASREQNYPQKAKRKACFHEQIVFLATKSLVKQRNWFVGYSH